MTKQTLQHYAKNPRRAALKIILIAVVLIAVSGFIEMHLKEPVLDRLKFNLSVGSLIGLVVAANLISLLCIALLYTAYQWVRRDLKAPRSEDESGLNE